MNNNKTHAFTLIELIAVVAIIAILSSILLPVANGILTQARITKSKTRLSQYINALELFKSEYNYYPNVGTPPDSKGNVQFELSGTANSQNFVEALSGRTHDTGDLTTVGGNYRQIQFYSFSEKEFRDNGDSNFSSNRLADEFNNTNIFIMVDADGDGRIQPFSTNPATPGEIKGTATAWVGDDGENPTYALWE